MLTGILRFRKVEDVTTPKDEPAPVYLLDELVKASQASPEDAQHIVEHLVKKLDSKSPIVKAKSLRACKYLVQKGARDAHRILQRNATPIRQLQNYRGVTDPLKGDALNERVRTSAKEAVAAIFSADTTSVQLPAPSQSRIQGFGSQSVLPPTGGTSSVSSRMVGFGSERFSKPSVDTVSGSSVLSYDSQPTTTFTASKQTASFLSNHHNIEVENGQRYGQTSYSPGSVLGNEGQLVDSICTPGGVRSAPAKEDLRRFIDTAGSLNGSKIAVKLHEKLEGKNWQECYRALCAIEAVILQGSSVSCGEIGVHFQSDLDIIRRCTKSMQKSIRDRAQRILDIFVEVDDEENPDEPQSIEDAPPLIDGIIEDPQSNPPSIVDLLDDNISGVNNSSSELFNGLDVTPDSVEKAPAATTETQMSDMFSGLALSDSATPSQGSNVHLAALLAPSPASDPFPEAMTPLKAESSVPQQSQPPQPPVINQGTYPAPMPGIVPPYGPPHAPVMGGSFVGQVPMMPPQQPGVMPFVGVLPMQPNMAPTGYSAPMMNPYGNYMQPVQQQAVPPQGPDGGNRGEVPLSAFMGPAHIERRNSSGKAKSHFSFVGDHISELREKK